MAKVNKSTNSNNIVVQNIVIKQTNRQTQDIDKWRNALKQFENRDKPLRTPLYDLLEDIMLDGHLESVTSKRTEKVTNKNLICVKDGIEDVEINKVLNSSAVFNIIKELHKSIYYGYTLIQINNIYYDEENEQYDIDYDVIPKKHVHPERGFECISLGQNDITKDILYKEPPLSKYMIWAGDAYNYGLLTKCAQYVIYKRGDFGDWAQFTEMFGMPFREGRYDDYDDNTRMALERAMEAYGGASYAILPKNADFKLHEAVKGTAGDLYKALKDACNDELSKIILGNTLTTEQGENGARSLGDVHMDAEKNKEYDDQRMILSIMNGKFKAILKLFGFNVQGSEIWYKTQESDWNYSKTKWEVISGIAQKIPIDDDFIYEEFDIPKPENYEAMKEEINSLNTNTTVFKENLKADKKTLLKNIADFFV